jgi:AcrR family transcriptional regulator
MQTAPLSRAERRQHTREELIAAADERFTARGFHATTVDEVAAHAGYTKGAVYSNFHSKEDLFFAVYERRAQRGAALTERRIAERGADAAVRSLARDTTDRRGRNDGWLAVFLEFWAHVVRNPELRGRFAGIHAAAQAPVVAAVERVAADREAALPGGPLAFTVAMGAMQVGLTLELLTRPEAVDAAVGLRLFDLALAPRDGAGAAGGPRKGYK